MKTIRGTVRFRLAGLVLLSCIGLVSCAGAPKVPKANTLGSLLDPYTGYLSGSAQSLTPALLDAAWAAESIRASLDKLLPRGQEPGTARSPGEGTVSPFQSALQAAFLGSSSGLSPAVARQWKHGGQGWENATTGYSFTLPDQDILLVASSRVNRLLTGAQRADPAPGRAMGEQGAEVLVWMSEPLAHLGLSITLHSAALSDIRLPLRGILLVGSLPESGANDSADADPELSFDAVFLLDGPSSAGIYKPLLRMAWVYLAKNWLGATTPSATPSFVRRGDKIFATDIRIKASSLAKFAAG